MKVTPYLAIYLLNPLTGSLPKISASSAPPAIMLLLNRPDGDDSNGLLEDSALVLGNEPDCGPAPNSIRLLKLSAVNGPAIIGGRGCRPGMDVRSGYGDPGSKFWARLTPGESKSCPPPPWCSLEPLSPGELPRDPLGLDSFCLRWRLMSSRVFCVSISRLPMTFSIEFP